MFDDLIRVPGQLVWDKEDAQWMVAVRPTDRQMNDLPPNKQKIIREADSNAEWDTSNHMAVADLLYIGTDETSPRPYTFPASRLEVASGCSATNSYPPAVYAQALLLNRVMDVVDLTEIELMEAGIDGQVILCANDLRETEKEL